MPVRQTKRFHLFLHLRRAAAPACALLVLFAIPLEGARASQQSATAPRIPPALGTIRTISTDNLTLATDAGTEVKVQIPADVKVLQVPPGSKDLKEAAPIQLSDLQPGDRILVRSKQGQEPGTFVAATIIAMKKADIAVKHEKEREEWQHGIGGLVTNVDLPQNSITIKTLTAAGSKDVVVHASQSTLLRRYAPGSVSFDEAKVAPIADIKPGDQLRARGTRSSDGSEFTADEIVSGSFRNVAGLVSGVNVAAGTVTVNDIASKKPVELRVTSDSQMRKLPPEMAQRIAMRLKAATAGPNGGGAPTGQPGGQPASTATAGSREAGAVAHGNSGAGGPGGAPRNGGGDLQQMLSRLPMSPLNEFQKGDVVMVVATSGQGDGPSTVITLLGGVEPVLQATTQGQAASILTPWSLSQGGGGDAGTP